MIETAHLSIEDKEKIYLLMESLRLLRFDQDRLIGRMLDGVMEMIPCENTCSLLQMNRFFSELDENGNKGKCLKVEHRNPPSRIIVKMWEKLTMRSISHIENAIYKKQGAEKFGALRLYDFMTKEEWSKSNVRRVAHYAGIEDLAYLWIRCAKDDLWIFCLRRGRQEEKFSLRDVAILAEFGHLFFQFRNWVYVEKLKKMLTKKERQIVALLSVGKTPEQIAKTLGIAVNTYYKHMQNIYNKFDAHDPFSLFLKLENDRD